MNKRSRPEGRGPPRSNAYWLRLAAHRSRASASASRAVIEGAVFQRPTRWPQIETRRPPLARRRECFRPEASAIVACPIGPEPHAVSKQLGSMVHVEVDVDSASIRLPCSPIGGRLDSPGFATQQGADRDPQLPCLAGTPRTIKGHPISRVSTIPLALNRMQDRLDAPNCKQAPVLGLSANRGAAVPLGSVAKQEGLRTVRGRDKTEGCEGRVAANAVRAFAPRAAPFVCAV
jgi:hypothetical protein